MRRVVFNQKGGVGKSTITGNEVQPPSAHLAIRGDDLRPLALEQPLSVQLRGQEQEEQQAGERMTHGTKVGVHARPTS